MILMGAAHSWQLETKTSLWICFQCGKGLNLASRHYFFSEAVQKLNL
jgi:hypothetical protein